MRLSEAIRLGAMLKPQGFGAASIIGEMTCALGAASDAAGLDAGYQRNSQLFEKWPILLRPVTFPVGLVLPAASVMYVAIWSLNDWHHWSREAIADWVAEQEAAMSAVVETPETVSV